MSFDGRKILVTGAAGFIGSNLVENLLSFDCKVLGLDNFSNGRMKNLRNVSKNPNFSLLKGDIRNYEFLRDNLKDLDFIFHQAALGSVPRSIENPHLTNEVNVNGTLNLLMIARKLDVERFIYASSSSVYGEKEILPKREDMPPEPISPYAVSKLAAENYVHAFYRVYGLNTASLRYFNVYGPNQIASPYSGVIAIFISRALQKQPLIIYGDGEQTRDFTYVKDVVDANLLTATKKSAIGQVFNIGFGVQTSVLALSHLVLELCNQPNLEIQFQAPRKGDVLHSYADNNSARNLLEFNPKYNLKKGILETINWFQLMV